MVGGTAAALFEKLCGCEFGLPCCGWFAKWRDCAAVALGWKVGGAVVAVVRIQPCGNGVGK